MNQIGEMRKFTGTVKRRHIVHGIHPGETFRGFYHGHGIDHEGDVFYLYEDLDGNLRKSWDFEIDIKFDGLNGDGGLCQCDPFAEDWDVLNCKCGDKNEPQ